MTTFNRRRLALCMLFALPLAIGVAVYMRPQVGDPRTAHHGDFDPAPLKAVLAARQELDRTLWAPEQLALAHENTFVRLWDALRSQQELADVLNDFTFESITLGQPSMLRREQNLITTYTLDREARAVAAQDFRDMVSAWRQAGYQLEQSEWHHEAFLTNAAGCHVSTMQVTLHVKSARTAARIEISGPLVVSWSGFAAAGFPIPRDIDARGLVISMREGAAAFEERFRYPLETIQTESTYNDVLARDLDGDGLSELAYPRTNLLLRNRGLGEFQMESLCAHPLREICDGLLVDFTGDGRSDLLCAAVSPQGTNRALFLYAGDDLGHFSAAPRQLTRSSLELPSPDSMTVGDIDLDGDLDIFVTQYHGPYRDGKMPAPYFDANDGLPCYLFVNDGQGSLRDETEARGISAKRRRRAYRSSLVDLDDDGDLDLLVTSDFSGIDVYENNGRGSFRDVTAQWFDERTLFGMSHVFADFDNDAELDLYATGMASTTARRLDALGLFRAEFPADQRRRAQLAYGNRLYFHRPGPRYLESPSSTDVARAGWSWGCAAFDADNDGDVDLYVANGHLSGASAADYCSRFWCHDIYVGHHQTPGFEDLIRRNSLHLGTDVSWNGYEKNRMFLNRQGNGFLNAGFLMDVAMEEDSRSVLADDIDGDGRMDLLVGFAERRSRPAQYVLRGLMNHWNAPHHWIGVRPVNVPAACLIGAKVIVETAAGRRVDTIITGESFAAQQAPMAHFGLGGTAAVEAIEVRWVGGRRTRLERPAVDRYHDVAP